MKKLVAILVFMGMSAFAAAAGAVVIDFEDLYPAWAKIPSGYAGFNWSYEPYSITKDSIPDSGYEFGTIGNESLYFWSTYYDNNISLISGAYFDFTGAYITAAWDDTENVIVEGWDGVSLLYSTTITTHNDKAYWFDFSYLNIDTLWFRPLERQIVIDNITYNETAPIPEPTTMLLLGSGLIGLAGFRKKLKK